MRFGEGVVVLGAVVVVVARSVSFLTPPKLVAQLEANGE